MRRAALAAASVLLVVLAGLWPLPAATAPPTEQEQALLERYAPVVAVRRQSSPCGNGERFRPIAVDAILGRDDVVLRNASGDIVTRAPTAADLAGRGPDLWIDLPGNALHPGCTYERWAKALDAEPSVYGRVTGEAGRLVVQYWFFWVYNQWNDVHEGDWEMIQLVFDVGTVAEAMTAGPVTYAYAQHEGSEYATVGENDDKVVLVDGVRPVVFPGEGSHAAYFSSSRWFGKSGATGFGCDDTTAPIERLSPAVIALPGDDVPTAGAFAWLSYTGHWGQKAPAFDNGPTGPVTKTQWSAPVTWVEEEGRSSAVALPFAESAATETFCDLSAWGSGLYNRLLDRPILVVGTVVLVAVGLVLVVRCSSRGVLGRAARSWRRLGRRLAPVGGVVLGGLVASALVQWLLLHLTPLGSLVDTLGDSSGWVVPVVGAVGSLIATPALAWAGASTILAAEDPGTSEPVRTTATIRRPAIWSALVLLVLGAAMFAVPLLAVLLSRWLAAPVLANRDGTTTRAALAASNRLVRGHAWRALGMVVTLLLLASIAGVVGAIVLVLTDLTFRTVALLTALVGVAVVPYIALVVVELTRELEADRR